MYRWPFFFEFEMSSAASSRKKNKHQISNPTTNENKNLIKTYTTTLAVTTLRRPRLAGHLLSWFFCGDVISRVMFGISTRFNLEVFFGPARGWTTSLLGVQMMYEASPSSPFPAQRTQGAAVDIDNIFWQTRPSSLDWWRACFARKRYQYQQQLLESVVLETEKREGASYNICTPKIDTPFNTNEKRSAWTCWRSGVKFSHGTTTGRWRSYDRTNSLRTPTMQENQLLREKTTSSVFQHVQTLCMPSFIDLHTHATPG